jgi:hypothetical protein
MLRRFLTIVLSLASAVALAADPPVASAKLAAKTEAAPAQSKRVDNADPKALSGMSILGNQEAPKALVIVPWKSSQLGDTLGISKTLDDGRQPVDKEVFMRQLSYYEIRANSK